MNTPIADSIMDWVLYGKEGKNTPLKRTECAMCGGTGEIFADENTVDCPYCEATGYANNGGCDHADMFGDFTGATNDDR